METTVWFHLRRRITTTVSFSLKMVAPSMKDGQVSAGHIRSGSQLLNLVKIGKAKVKAAQVLEREEKSPEKR